MQSLYEWEFRDESLPLKDIVKRNIHEFEKDVDAEYVHKVTMGVQENWAEIDKMIAEAAPEWPLDQVARVDRSVIRVAIFEMLFDPEDDVPPRVSINEAVEIGKTFGSENASKFVNGVLGFVYRKNEAKLIPRDAVPPKSKQEKDNV